ncbi:hypothetical protein GCM10027440_38090 [Nocardiopsis coralliicola]
MTRSPMPIRFEPLAQQMILRLGPAEREILIDRLYDLSEAEDLRRREWTAGGFGEVGGRGATPAHAGMDRPASAAIDVGTGDSRGGGNGPVAL